MYDTTNFTVLLTAALLTGFLHTITGPDHYLPFIAIAKSRNYGWKKTMLWTLLCGIGHIGSALLLAAGFFLFAELLSNAQLAWFEEWRGSIAAYALIGMGSAILIHALYARWKRHPHTHKHRYLDGTVVIHRHEPSDHTGENEKNLSYWVLFLIFVFGPCEALLPLLTAASVLGTASVILTAIVFSLATILTMLAAVLLGTLGIQALRKEWMEQFASEIAGGTILVCGLAILCMGL